MRISDWSSDVCSSDLIDLLGFQKPLRQCLSGTAPKLDFQPRNQGRHYPIRRHSNALHHAHDPCSFSPRSFEDDPSTTGRGAAVRRSEEHTSEPQSIMRISYAVFCLTNKKVPLRTSISSIPC